MTLPAFITPEQTLDTDNELLQIDGFLKMHVETRLKCSILIVCTREGRQGNRRNVAEISGQLAHLPDKLEPVHIGHSNIADHDIWLESHDFIESLSRRSAGFDRCPTKRAELLEHTTGGIVVLNQEDAHSMESLRFIIGVQGCPRQTVSERQPDGKS